MLVLLDIKISILLILSLSLSANNLLTDYRTHGIKDIVNKMDEDLIVEVWDIFREYIPDKNKETAASHYIDMLLGKDVDPETLTGLLGYDPILDDAIKLAIQDEVEDDADEYDEDGWDQNEDEE